MPPRMTCSTIGAKARLTATADRNRHIAAPDQIRGRPIASPSALAAPPRAPVFHSILSMSAKIPRQGQSGRYVSIRAGADPLKGSQ
jgi:hypothetical protein